MDSSHEADDETRPQPTSLDPFYVYAVLITIVVTLICIIMATDRVHKLTHDNRPDIEEQLGR